MSRTEADILTGMETLLANPAAWTKNSSARDGEGNEAPVHSDEAKCFCLLGAKIRVLGPHVPPGDILNRNVGRRLAAAANAAFPSRVHKARETPGPMVGEFNDHDDTTHADVIEVIRLARAI